MTEPDIIRDQSPHAVEMSENSKVAVSKTGEANAPSVRKVLASPDSAVSEPVAQEHRVLVPAAARSDDSGALAVPAPLAQDAAAALEIPAELPQAVRDEPDVPVADLQGGTVLQVDPGEGQALPDLDIPPDGSLAKRGTLDIPAGQADRAATLDIAAGDPSARPELNLSPADAPATPLGIDQIKTLLSQLDAPASEATVQEQLGGPDAVWVEMDYPARIIKLKIENDKVRDKLDTLERKLGPAR